MRVDSGHWGGVFDGYTARGEVWAVLQAKLTT